MACIDDEGRLFPLARMVLELLGSPQTADEVIAASKQPPFLVRKSLRELHGRDFVAVDDEGRYLISDSGRRRLAEGSDASAAGAAVAT